MVTLEQARATNSRVATALPPSLVAVFVGATSGIGSTALLAFAKHAARPRIYFIGRSEEAAEKLTKQMKEANPEGQYVFLKKDLSLMENTDEVCKEIASREKSINVLFLCQGILKSGDTSEGLPLFTAVALYSRMRMAVNLLPLVRQATTLRRIVSVLAGGREGKLHIDDIAGRKVPLRDTIAHNAAVMTLGLEALSKKAPEVSFIHNYPGRIRTDLVRPESGWMLQPLRWLFKPNFDSLIPGLWMPYEECGERHAFLCVSGRYPAKKPVGNGDEEGVRMEDVAIVRGIDGEKGSGAYTVDDFGECATDETLRLLSKYRSEGNVDKVWQHLESEFKRITGTEAVQLG